MFLNCTSAGGLVHTPPFFPLVLESDRTSCGEIRQFSGIDDAVEERDTLGWLSGSNESKGQHTCRGERDRTLSGHNPRNVYRIPTTIADDQSTLFSIELHPCPKDNRRKEKGELIVLKHQNVSLFSILL